jgi:phosphoribosylformylglycinamidine cyclo-ligase
MERAWNCGIGMTAIVEAGNADLAIKSLAARGMKAWEAGVIQKRDAGQKGSVLVGEYAKR